MFHAGGANPNANSDECRDRAREYLKCAEDLKKGQYESARWYGFGLPYQMLGHRPAFLFVVAMVSLLLQLGYAVAETYPGNITKPNGLKWWTASVVVVQILGHGYLFLLSRDLDRYIKYSMICVVLLGLAVAIGKLVECFMICSWVDEQMPADHAGRFCVVALSLAQGLTSIVTAMGHSRSHPIILDRPGEIFYGFGHPYCFPALNIEEKRVLVGAIIRSKFWRLCWSV